MINKKLILLTLISGILTCCNLFEDPIHIDSTTPEKPVITISLDSEQAKALGEELTYETGRNILAVRMVRENKLAKTTLSGEYHLKNSILSFTPMNQLGEGLEFEVQYYMGNDTVKKRFLTPSAPVPVASPPEVEEIFPLTDRIPKNILIFHVRFNQQMLDDPQAFLHVKITDSKGEEKKMAWRHKSHWLDDSKVLVLMIHPGRIKRGIDYKKEELGDLFTIGESYTLEVTPEIKNQYHKPLLKTYTKRFTITPEDRKIPEIKFNQFQFPGANTLEPLTLTFSEGMDYASIFEEIKILDSKGQEISGSIAYTGHDSIFHYIPKKQWEQTKYEIKFGKLVADFAHNRLNSPFEIQSLDEIKTDITSRKWEFSPK